MYCDINVVIMENRPEFHPHPKLKLMEQVYEVLRYHHLPTAPSKPTPSGYWGLMVKSARDFGDGVPH